MSPATTYFTQNRTIINYIFTIMACDFLFCSSFFLSVYCLISTIKFCLQSKIVWGISVKDLLDFVSSLRILRLKCRCTFIRNGSIGITRIFTYKYRYRFFVFQKGIIVESWNFFRLYSYYKCMSIWNSHIFFSIHVVLKFSVK